MTDRIDFFTIEKMDVADQIAIVKNLGELLIFESDTEGRIPMVWAHPMLTFAQDPSTELQEEFCQAYHECKEEFPGSAQSLMFNGSYIDQLAMKLADINADEQTLGDAILNHMEDYREFALQINPSNNDRSDPNRQQKMAAVFLRKTEGDGDSFMQYVFAGVFIDDVLNGIRCLYVHRSPMYDQW